MPQPASQIVEELSACIACNECLVVCPALAEPIPIETLNGETLLGPASAPVVRFARACYQCGACVPVCPVGLHRDAMMMRLKAQLLSGARTSPSSQWPQWSPMEATEPVAEQAASDQRRPVMIRGRFHDR